MIHEYFKVKGTQEAVLDYSDLFGMMLHDDDVQGFDTRWDEVLLSIRKVSQTIFWKACMKRADLSPIHSKPCWHYRNERLNNIIQNRPTRNRRPW